jgi:prepilin-type N-terminal cleavage/methylation domain-containing protein
MHTSTPTLIHVRGFTLVETLLVLALMSVLISVSLTEGLASFTRGLSQNDRQLAVSALREARAEAMDGTCTGNACAGPLAHGVFISQSGVTIFEGASYADRLQQADQVLLFSAEETVSDTYVLFAADTGDVSTDMNFSIQRIHGPTENILVNTQGAISSLTL